MTEWFVEPLGDAAHANKVFSDKIGPAEQYTGHYEDEAGKGRDVWSCESYSQVLKFWKSRKTLKIDFDVWNRERNYGPIRWVNFLMPGWRPRRESVQKAGAVDF